MYTYNTNTSPIMLLTDLLIAYFRNNCFNWKIILCMLGCIYTVFVAVTQFWPAGVPSVWRFKRFSGFCESSLWWIESFEMENHWFVLWPFLQVISVDGELKVTCLMLWICLWIIHINSFLKHRDRAYYHLLNQANSKKSIWASCFLVRYLTDPSCLVPSKVK